MVRRLGVAVALLATTLVAALAQPADGSRYLRIGIYDEAQTLYGPVAQTFSMFNGRLDNEAVRVNPGDLVRIYYGAADDVTAVADLSLDEILAGLA